VFAGTHRQDDQPKEMAMSKGVKMIEEERRRQVDEEGWTADHDAEHDDDSLAAAAACYAAPEKVYVERRNINGPYFVDPWPWEPRWDKRYSDGNKLPDPATYSNERRLDMLVKAGALIAAEIDRRLAKVDAPARASNDTQDESEDDK